MSASSQTGLRDIRASTGDGSFSSSALLPGHVTGTNCKLQPCGSQRLELGKLGADVATLFFFSLVAFLPFALGLWLGQTEFR